MKSIGIYRKALPRPSEVFIREQARLLTRYAPIYIVCKLLKDIEEQHVALSQSDQWGIKQALHILTRTPNGFPLDHLKKLDLIHAHFGPDGVYALALAEKIKRPLLVTFHGHDITVKRSAMWKSGNPSYYQLIFQEAALQKKAANFIAVSKFIHSRLLQQGYPSEKIIQHYIGVDLEKFSPRKQPPTERYILCVARHTAKKGVDMLIKGFAKISYKYPQIDLIQVGQGDRTSKLKALANELGIGNRIRFLGAQPYSVVQSLMKHAEIFALPSQTAEDGNSEALGIVFNEASACAIPIISTQHGGIPEAVLDGETGFLVPEKSDQALAEKLDILLSDRGLGQEMGRRGREFVEDVFDLRKQTEKLEAIYDSVL
jgi:colanic acid/amylovoran biosynthesis glycosyltransferase